MTETVYYFTSVQDSLKSLQNASQLLGEHNHQKLQKRCYSDLTNLITNQLPRLTTIEQSYLLGKVQKVFMKAKKPPSLRISRAKENADLKSRPKPDNKRRISIGDFIDNPIQTDLIPTRSRIPLSLSWLRSDRDVPMTNQSSILNRLVYSYWAQLDSFNKIKIKITAAESKQQRKKQLELIQTCQSKCDDIFVKNRKLRIKADSLNQAKRHYLSLQKEAKSGKKEAAIIGTKLPPIRQRRSVSEGICTKDPEKGFQLPLSLISCIIPPVRAVGLASSRKEPMLVGRKLKL